VTPLIAMLVGYWDLDERTARRWWTAVCRARWSVVQEWRQRVVLFDQGIIAPLTDPQAVDAVARFLDTSAAPAQVMAILEALVGERVLSRQDARQMETKVLARVNRHGQWI
jgi:hypothetical protein